MANTLIERSKTEQQMRKGPLKGGGQEGVGAASPSLEEYLKPALFRRRAGGPRRGTRQAACGGNDPFPPCGYSIHTIWGAVVSSYICIGKRRSRLRLTKGMGRHPPSAAVARQLLASERRRLRGDGFERTHD